MTRVIQGGKFPGLHCPTCNALVDGFIGIDGEFMPRPGDVSVCASCSQLLIWVDVEVGRLRLATDAETAKLAEDPSVCLAREIVTRIRLGE